MNRTLATVALSLAALSFAAPQMHAQTALQFVPVITTAAGGATATTLCAAATDTIGDGCPATQSILSGPIVPDSDAAGNIYFADSGHNVIRRIDAVTNIITVVAGQVSTTATVCANATDTIGDGCLATQATLNSPHAVHFDRAGNMIIVDSTNQYVRSVNSQTGIITALLGTGKQARGVPNNTKPSTPLTQVVDNPWNCFFYPNGDMLVLSSTGDSAIIAIAINGLIDPINSKVYDVAGNGNASSSATALNGDGGPAISALMNTSRGLAPDYAGNIFIGDYGDMRVRKVTSSQVNFQTAIPALSTATISSYVGTGAATSTGDGGLASAATVTMPQGLTFDNAGNLYIQEYSAGHDFIRIVNPVTTIINTYAGTGAGSFSGDGGPAIKATLQTDSGMKFNLGNRLTITDGSNARVRTIFPTPFFSGQNVGTTSAAENAIAQATVATTLSTATINNTEFKLGTLSGCSLNGALAASAYCTLPLTFAPAGPGLRSATLQLKDGSGNFYNEPLLGIGEAPSVAFIGAPIATVAGNGTAGNTGNAGAASTALVSAPSGGVFDGIGNFYFADSANNQVREITRVGTMALIAGNGTAGFGGDNAAATAAQLNAPAGVTVDAAGNVYIADSANNRIRKVTAATGIITTVAGTGTAGFAGDGGVPAAAQLSNPSGIAIDNAGVLYVADTGNNALRAFSPQTPGVMTTLVGSGGGAGYTGDGSTPQLAQLNAPTAVTVDLAGNIYIADTGNSVIRRLTEITPGIINFNGTLSTYAGVSGSSSNSGDGGPATSAHLNAPSAIAVDAAGNLYIASAGQIRLVTAANGNITTLAGTGGTGSYSGDNGSALASVIPSAIRGLAVDNIGNLYASATTGNRIVSITGATAATLTFGSQTVGTSTTSQTVTVYNSGNTTLSFSSVVIPANYTVSTATTNPCLATTTLPAGGSCTITVAFTPTTSGTLSANIVLTDNALNSATSTQNIPLTGVGVTPGKPLTPTTTAISTSPAVPTYGQTINVIATVTGTSSPTGNVDFIINGFRAATSPLVNGQATVTLSSLRVGTDTVTANYLGDTANQGSSISSSFTVNPAVLTVKADNQQKYPGQPNPTLTYTITGFVYSDTAASVLAGSPTISTTATVSSPVGIYPITVGIGTLAAANYTFNLVNGTLTVIPPDFSISINPTSLTLPAGGVAAIIVTVHPSFGYSGTVNFSCGTLPAHVFCKFNADSLAVDSTGDGTMQLTISSDNFQHVASNHHGELFTLSFGLPLLSLSFLFGGKSRRRWMLRSALALTFLVAGQALTGCGLGLQNAAPSSATITITVTDKANNITRSVNLPVTLQ